MKVSKFILLTTLMTLCAACSSYDEPVLNETVNSESKSANRLTVSQAEKIASDVIANFSDVDKTRAETPSPSVEFVIRSAKTRSAAANDTIAYVFNYPDNGGFVMMSPDPTLEDPLVAYSDKGNLDINDEFVNDQIIYPLENYIEATSTVPGTRATIDPLPGFGGTTTEVVEWLSPQLIISLNQRSPWNSVVVSELKKEQAAGCVPVACALILSRCKTNFTLRNKQYNFEEITKCIAINQGVPELGSTTYSYTTAVNQMAQLLWDIGQEIGATYYEDGSTGATNSVAITNLINWGLTSSTNKLVRNYNENTIKNYLNDNNLIYISGHCEVGERVAGHAWVADGYQVLRRKTDFVYLPSVTYIHFNWGWGGKGDGYYNGTIYTPYSGCSATIYEYCTFKIQN